MHIGILYSGIYWQEYGIRNTGYPHKLVYIYDKKWNIDEYDILIIPKGIHQSFLVDNHILIHDWVSTGGVLVVFGEQDGNWAVGFDWSPSVLGRRVKILETNHQIVESINEDNINSWSEVVHGHYTKMPENSTVLICEDGDPQRSLLVIDNSSTAGIALYTTLDPDYHSYTGDKSALIMYKNIISWAINESSKIHARNPRKKRPDFASMLLERFNDRASTSGLLASIATGVTVTIILKLLFDI